LADSQNGYIITLSLWSSVQDPHVWMCPSAQLQKKWSTAQVSWDKVLILPGSLTPSLPRESAPTQTVCHIPVQQCSTPCWVTLIPWKEEAEADFIFLNKNKKNLCLHSMNQTFSFPLGLTASRDETMGKRRM
jgi:hypothetical protein